MLKDRVVLVTGSTGFIGGRLVEKLILDQQANVRALVHHYSSAARIARFDVAMPVASLTDSAALETAIEGSEVVIHCAYDPSSLRANIDGIRILADICLRHNIRLVHVSSISVYEPLKDGDLDEHAEATPGGIPYADNKIEIEEEVFQYVRERGLQAVVLQPTIVYGPFGKPWTLNPIKKLLSGTVVLPDQGEGLCNLVYVDDVCNALIGAAGMDGVIGERFLISGSEPVSWKQFFQAYETILGVKSVSYMPGNQIEQMLRNPISNLKLLVADPKRIAGWKPARYFASFAADSLPDWATARLEHFFGRYNQIAGRPKYLPTLQLLNLYRAKCRVRIDKAKRMLDYSPKYDVDRGMDLTGKFIRWAFPVL